jgi:Tol biopolymer transport system component
MAYASTNMADQETTIRLKDFATGTDRVVADHVVTNPRDIVSISPDGSHLVFEQPENGVFSAYIMSAVGGSPLKLCDTCEPRGFSSDGSRILMQKYNSPRELDHIVMVDLVSKAQQPFLKDTHRLYHAFFSWDDQWVVFKRWIDAKHSQLLIAPVRNGVAARNEEWIVVTDGSHADDKPQFAPDNKLLYFTSDRDGFLCIWGVRLNPATKRPEGAPFAIHHFHNVMGWYSGSYIPDHASRTGLSVARDKIVTNLAEPKGDIWLAQLD